MRGNDLSSKSPHPASDPLVSNRLDTMLDAALHSYAQPEWTSEPEAMTARLLARARAQRLPRLRIWAWAVPIIACAVALLVAGMVWMLRIPHDPRIAWTPQPPKVVARAEVLPPAPVRVLGKRAPHRLTRHPGTAPPQSLPKSDVFPTPTPLTPEEKALVAFASNTPPALRDQVIQQQEHLGDPIQIAELKIRPLDVDDTHDQPTGKDLP